MANTSHVREIEAQGDAVAEDLIDIAVAQDVVSSQHDDEQEQVGKNKIPFRLLITRPQINTEECKHDDYDIHNKLYSAWQLCNKQTTVEIWNGVSYGFVVHALDRTRTESRCLFVPMVQWGLRNIPQLVQARQGSW